MSIEFLLDENIPFALIDFLEERGFPISSKNFDPWNTKTEIKKLSDRIKL